MLAELFVAILASQVFVGVLRVSFWVKLIYNFPLDKKEKGKSNESQRKYVIYEYKRCEHHCIIPVVNSAGCAAFIFKYPRLKRAEKEYAYHIANGKSERDKNEDSCVVNA